jgi:hypothetical protein
MPPPSPGVQTSGEQQFIIGPDKIGAEKKGDLRQQRPYFLVPLLEETTAAEVQTVRERIAAWVRTESDEKASPLMHPDELGREAAQTLASRLRTGDDELTRYIRERLGPDTRQMLERELTLSRNGRLTLLNELNALLHDEALYSKVPVGQRAEVLRDWPPAPPRGRDLLQWNRTLLHRFFPSEVPEVSKKGPITDVYILSHGWHRNFFSAVAAYDKLMSGLSVLMHRGRIRPPRRFHPLYLTLHWHSDPGEDGWEDRAGRRDKTSFLSNVAQVFDRPTTEAERAMAPARRFTNVFEDIFQLFSQMSVPGPGALSDPNLHAQAVNLAERLRDFHLRDAAGAEPAEKVAAAWACYHRAEPKRVLVDQAEPPGRYISFFAAVRNLAAFVLGCVGILALLGLLWQVGSRLTAIHDLEEQVGAWWEQLPDWVSWAVPIGALAISLLILVAAARRNIRDARGGSDGWVVFLLAVAWIYVQVIFTIPLALYLLPSYLLGWLWPPQFGGLFDERFGGRNQAITALRMRWVNSPLFRLLYVRYWLAAVARFPLRLLSYGLLPDSRLAVLVDELDGYLAFWDMQIRGVKAGSRAAGFLARLLDDPELVGLLGSARVHFLGHSFGGLVVANAVRHLALDEALVNYSFSALQPRGPDGEAHSRKIQTLCLLQGAMASAWFEGERRLFASLNGALACVYSRYDTANGLYYPIANHGRLAAGYVGLYLAGYDLDSYRLPDAEREGDEGLFASLTEPPPLQGMLQQMLRDSNQSFPGAWFVNLDASRLIYDGSIATGGGHQDIFKDDVLHLVWAVSRLGPPRG